ncbi:MAG: endopeptidase La [Proteobacteria bacterium]|nr:endopeptidase La [Pseudomonadota bacterium]MBU1709278.1 endopeptidase La [Pseudomonadota bacterium]
MTDKPDKMKKTPDFVKKSSSGVNPVQLPVPEVLSVLPIYGFVFFPGMGFPLQVTNPQSKQMIDQALLGDKLVAIVSQQQTENADKKTIPGELHSVGIMGYIHKMVKAQEGFYQVLVSAVKRIRVTDFIQKKPFYKAKVTEYPMQGDIDQEVDAFVLNLQNQFRKLTDLSNLPSELQMTISSIKEPSHVAYFIISQLNLPIDEEQRLLEFVNLKELLQATSRELSRRLETVEMSNAIQKNVKDDMDGKQKEFYLRQQLKAIRKELGEDQENPDLAELKTKLKEADLDEEAQKTAVKELARLERISPSSPEYTVSRTYLDWLLELPWKVSTKDTLDINNAQKTLDQDHYGLEVIKKRIIEFLAVRKLKNDMHGPILCFSGPPGVGKTSLGQSIARTMNRKFVRISLGGVRDEAEIRGHRRTYIGALPGRIIQSLRKTGSNNPLFMLDEIDKLGMDFRGDPSSALLEVLDPEQNFTFADHYLEIPFDLSKVMFITTANFIDNIPGPLRDRMEIIELSGYTEHEKVMIAKRHLVPKQLEAHALTRDNLRFTDSAIRHIIRYYTREAGVRGIERKLAGVCRGVAKDIVSGKKKLVTITPEEVANFLGLQQFFPETKARSWGPGLATGLAWTPVGGVLLFIEAAKMTGRGGLSLTGKLGDVMKESAAAALTYIRSHTAELEINDKLFAENDLHIHVPEGAIPKDGPSAGVSIVVALASLLTGRPVRKNIAMTGEITLRGDVLPVGGIKEKVLAAIRSGIKEVILPSLNEKDVVEMPDKVKKGIQFHFVHDIQTAFDLALIKQRSKKK